MREKKRNHYKNKGRIVKGILSFALALVMVFGTLPGMPFVMTARAGSAAPEKTITGLGTGAITNPVQPANEDYDWSGSYVYYGKYDGTNPTKYRVLDKASDKFGITGESLFLDCDSVLYDAAFDNDGVANSGASNPNEWAYSDVKAGLNGENFLTKIGNFTSAEKSAIAGSTVAAHALVVGSKAGQVANWTASLFKNYTPLTGEQIFLLDAEDASNIAYGYSTTDSGVGNRKKTGSDSYWWLRSANIYNYASCVFDGGVILGIVKDSLGVSPAFNVNLSSVIFSSLIPSGIAAGSPGAEYKLTLKDGGLSIAKENGGTRDASGLVSIPYTITDNSTGADPTQVSVVVTNGTWTESGWSDDAQLLQYAKLEMNSFGTSGTGTFTLDSSINGTWGTDYHVYILAEDVNGEKETDYASIPVEIKAVTATAAGYEGTYDGQAHGIAVTITDPTSGTTVKYGGSADNCTSDTSPTITSVSDSPKTVYYQVSADGYLTATGSADIKINKAPLTVKAKDKTIAYGDAPANNGVEYNGFVNSETESNLGGTLSYDYGYTQGNNIGSYTITPKGLTSDNYAISFETGTLTVEKANPVVTAPTAKEDLTYNGQAQELVNAGAATGGTMHYAVTTENTAPADESLYTTSIPTAVGAGTYYVWYKVVGDANHNDTTATSIIVTVAKAVIADYSVSGSSKAGTSGTVNISGLKKDGGSFGTLTVSPVSDNIFEEVSSVTNGETSDGVVSYKIKSSATVGDSAEITVPVTGCKNYKNYNIKIFVTVTDKDIPTVTVSDITTTYTGSAVPASLIKGTATHDRKTVAGTWSFKGETQGLTNVSDSGVKQVVFTPTDTKTYEAVETTLTLTIKKKDVTGSPSYTAIKTSGKTLQDAALDIGTLIPGDGIIKWCLSGDTVVARGTSYAWTYTPTDINNYNIKTGSIILWAASSGGSSGSGSGSGGSGGSGSSGSGSDPGTPTASPAPSETPAPSAAPEASPAPSTAPEASPAPSAAPGASSAPTIVEQKTETTQNPDGSTTTTTTTIDSVGTQKTESETVKADGTVEKSTETIKADGTTEKSTEKIKPNGSSEKQTEIVSADGSTEKITEKTKANGSSEKVTDITKPNGATIHEEVKTTAKGKETSQKIETSASGSVKITEQVKQPSGDHSKVVMNKTGKNSVAIKQAVTTAKTGKITIPKTVKVNGKKLKVTALKKNFLKGSETKPKKITINASDITKIAKGAFNGIAKKATIEIKAGKKDYKRIQKLIKNSGISKGVKIKRIK